MRIATVLCLFLIGIQAIAQIGIGTITPNESSILDISSTSSGILIPRMTENQRTNIATPAEGLLVYQNDNTSGFYFYNGKWTLISTSDGEFKSVGGVVQNTTSNSTDDFVFGSTQLDNDISTTTDNYRFFFDKSKGAFRAGYVVDSLWNSSIVGNFSFAAGAQVRASGNASVALGANNIASGSNSLALGAQTTASANYSTSMGFGTVASGFFSTATGANTLASGFISTAFGNETTASGNLSFVTGYQNTAPSYAEVTIGVFSENYTPISVGGSNSNDRIFSVGIGTNDMSRLNALTLLKNGNMGLGDSTPEATLDVQGTFQYVDGNQGVGKILTSDVDGNASWQTATLLLPNVDHQDETLLERIVKLEKEKEEIMTNYKLLETRLKKIEERIMAGPVTQD